MIAEISPAGNYHLYIFKRVYILYALSVETAKTIPFAGEVKPNSLFTSSIICLHTLTGGYNNQIVVMLVFHDVIGPVVTPPESNAVGINSSGAKNWHPKSSA